MAQKSRMHPAKALQTHAMLLHGLLSDEADTRKVRALPYPLAPLREKIEAIKNPQQYRWCVKRLVQNASLILGLPPKTVEPLLNGLALDQYWLTRAHHPQVIQTPYGSLSPIRMLTPRQCYELLRIFAQKPKDIPIWVQALPRVQQGLLKQGLLSAIAPMLPLKESDLQFFWTEVESQIRQRNKQHLIADLRSKRIQFNHHYRMTGAENVKDMIGLIQKSDLNKSDLHVVLSSIAQAAQQYIDQERLDFIWKYPALKEQLVYVLTKAIGFKPQTQNNVPGISNAWWFEGEALACRRLIAGHPVPDIQDTQECYRLTLQNLEQIWQSIAPPLDNSGHPSRVPVLIQSLRAPAWPDMNGEMKRNRILRGALGGLQLSKEVNDPTQHQAQLYFTVRPLGNEAAMSFQPKEPHLKDTIGQCALRGATFWPDNSRESNLLLAAAEQYNTLYDNVNAQWAQYQTPILGPIRSRLAYLSDSDDFKSRMLMLASLEQIIFGLSDGVCVTVCDNGMERSMLSFIHTDALFDYFEKYNAFPSMECEKDKARLGSLFASIIKGQWPSDWAASADPGKQTISCISVLPKHLRKAIKEKANKWYRAYSMRLNLPFAGQPLLSAPIKWIAWVPNILDLQGLCHSEQLSVVPASPPSPIPDQLPQLTIVPGRRRGQRKATQDKPKGASVDVTARANNASQAPF